MKMKFDIHKKNGKDYNMKMMQEKKLGSYLQTKVTTVMSCNLSHTSRYTLAHFMT